MVQKYVKVQFEKTKTMVYKTGGGNVYTYFVPDGDEPEVGDRVITSTSSELSFEQGYPVNFCMARVINVLTEDDGKADKHYLYLLPLKTLQSRSEENKIAKKRKADLAALKAAMDERIKGKLDLDRYRKFASDDAELAAMVNKFEELSK